MACYHFENHEKYLVKFSNIPCLRFYISQRNAASFLRHTPKVKWIEHDVVNG